MTSEPGQQTIATHILTNISRSKGNRIMKLGQLIEYLFFPGCDFITFEINLVFLIKHFFLCGRVVKTKI